jgi:opacity protein-like surface antigen
MRLAAPLFAAAVLTPSILLSGALLAADYPFPQPYEPPPVEAVDTFHWGGLYGGIHAAYSSGNFNTQSSAAGLATDAYRNSTAQSLAVGIAYLPTDFEDQAPSYGGFVGANWVWDDVILGLEAEVSAFNPSLSASGTYSAARRQDGGATSQVVDYTANVTTKITDYGILKLRAGYAMGRLLPFATLGFAVARGEIRATYSSLYSEYPMVGGVPDFGAPIISNQRNDAQRRNRGYLVGGSVGVGLDWAILDNVFARTEYTYLGFADFHGQKTTMHTIKAGLGIKY